jgi:hypothetical protein
MRTSGLEYESGISIPRQEPDHDRSAQRHRGSSALECTASARTAGRVRTPSPNAAAASMPRRAVEQTADPQTEAASRIVAWLSIGAVKPSGDDFAMLRLILLAMLPQVGGIMLMIGRNAADQNPAAKL